MPEGDTVRRLAMRINERCAGKIVDRAVMRDPRLVGVELAGRTLTEADAYGKHLFIRFDDDRSLHAHLMMTGGLRVGRPSPEPEWKRRVELWLGDDRLTGESVPILGIISTEDEHTITDRLGPDLCAVAGPPDPSEIAERLTATPDTPLTGAMLDQHRVAGFGNIYANDVPFITGVHPEQPVGSIAALDRLVAIGIALIRTNAERGPQNTTGRRLTTDARWVHGVGRGRCPVCATALRYMAGERTPWGRSITWCPECQPPAERCTVDVARANRLIGLHPAVKQAIYPRQI